MQDVTKIWRTLIVTIKRIFLQLNSLMRLVLINLINNKRSQAGFNTADMYPRKNKA